MQLPRPAQVATDGTPAPEPARGVARPCALVAGEAARVVELMAMLQEAGFDTSFFHGEVSALRLITLMSRGERDLLFLDLLDEPWASVAVLRVLGQRSPWITVVAVVDEGAVVAGILRVLGVPILRKPFDREGLEALIASLPQRRPRQL